MKNYFLLIFILGSFVAGAQYNKQNFNISTI